VIGSSTFLTDEIGRPRQYLIYLPFGETLHDQKAVGYDSRYKYTGKETDENTGLNYHGARYYNPSISMCNGVDPLADYLNQVDKSPFAAFWNNPIRYNDPDGRCPICPFILIGFLLLEAQPASTPGSDRDHVTIRQAQNEYATNQFLTLIPDGKQTITSQVVAGRVMNEVRSEIKEEVITR